MQKVFATSFSVRAGPCQKRDHFTPQDDRKRNLADATISKKEGYPITQAMMLNH
jgi:hypothetical protein